MHGTRGNIEYLFADKTRFSFSTVVLMGAGVGSDTAPTAPHRRRACQYSLTVPSRPALSAIPTVIVAVATVVACRSREHGRAQRTAVSEEDASDGMRDDNRDDPRRHGKACHSARQLPAPPGVARGREPLTLLKSSMMVVPKAK